MNDLTPEQRMAEEVAIAKAQREKELALPAGTTEVRGWVIPDRGDEALAQRLMGASVAGGRATYNFPRLMRALSYCTGFRTAIDVGAHVGFMSFWLRQIFDNLVSYEPHPLHFQCLLHNLHDVRPDCVWSTFQVALGHTAGRCGIGGKTSEKQHVNFRDSTVEMRTLDQDEWHAVDFLKIDCEGYELPVVEGAAETIRRFMPVIMVEQKEGVAKNRYGFDEQKAVSKICEIASYSVMWEMNGDFVLCPTKEKE